MSITCTQYFYQSEFIIIAHLCLRSFLGLHDKSLGCSALTNAVQAQAYVKHDINAGLAQEAANMRTQGPDSTSAGQSDVSASDRHAYAIAMGPDTFATMLKSIEKAYSLVSTWTKFVILSSHSIRVLTQARV